MSKEAKNIAKGRHDAHKPGQLPHYQPKSGGKGHVHYELKTAVGTAAAFGSTVAEAVESNTGSEGLGTTIGLIVDFVNPASDIQEAADFLQEIGNDIIESSYGVDLDEEDPSSGVMEESYHPSLIYSSGAHR